MSERKTYGAKSDAIKGAKRAGFDLSLVRVFRDEETGRWAWGALHAADREAMTEGDEVPPKVIDGEDAPEVEAIPEADSDEEDSTSPEALARRQAERMAAQQEAEEAAFVAKCIADTEARMDEEFQAQEADAPAEAAEAEAGEGEPDAGEQEPCSGGDAPRPATEPGLPAWLHSGRTFILCVEGDSFPQTSPHFWAIEFAHILKRPIVVRDATTFEALATYERQAKKAKRVPRPAGEAKPRQNKRDEAEAAADRGEMPPEPVFNQPSYHRYKPLLEGAIALVRARDVAGLEAYETKGHLKCQPRVIVERYRLLALRALRAQIIGLPQAAE